MLCITVTYHLDMTYRADGLLKARCLPTTYFVYSFLVIFLFKGDPKRNIADPVAVDANGI